jgi:CHAT domain-containing protein
MQNLVSLNTKGLASVLFLLITILLLVGTVAAQDRKTQAETVKRLMIEGTQLVKEGSPASLTKAIEKFESARTLLHSLDLPAGEGAMLAMLGFIYNQLEQDQKAIEKYEQSLVLFRAAGEKKGEATSLAHLGLIHSALGEIEKALDNFLQALLLFRAAGERQGEALTLATMANLHVSLGKPEESLTLFTKALEKLRATGFREGEAVVLTALGPLYNQAGQPQKARETMEQALSLSRDAGYRQGEALALVTLGFFYTSQLDLQKALETYEQALPLFRAEHDRVGESLTLHGLCANYISSRNYEKGFQYCAQSHALLRSMGHRQTEAMTLKHIAIGERNRGNLAASQTAIESAITIVESVRTKVVNPEFRLSYFAGSQDYYEFYIDLLMLLHKQHPNDGYDGKTLQASERARARFLLDTLNEANADIRQGIDAALLQRERETQRRLNARAQSQMQLLSQPHSEAQATAIAEEIQTLIRDLQQVEREIRQTSPRYAALMKPRPLTLKEIQTQVLDPDTLLLEYALGEERSYVWAVTSSSITSHELPKRAEIETAARRFYDLLNARNTRVNSETNQQRAVRVAQSDAEIPIAAGFLSRMVLAPIAGQLGNRRLMIVADDALHFVPFGVLPVVSGGASGTNRQRRVTRLLIEDHEIVNLPSASTLAVIRSEMAGRDRAPKSVVALADPVFMKNDERVKTGREAPVRVESKDRQLIQATEDTGVASYGLYVPRLPGTRQEAEQIIAMVPTNKHRLALDFAASRDTATSAELSQYSYVHFSTHGLLNSVHPELSGLVFSLVNERGETQDGFLRAHEIFNLKLSPEVVVLSACQTGMGKIIRGEGLGEFNARIHVCWSTTRGRKSVGCQRLGNDEVDGALLSWDIEGRYEARRGATSCAVIADERRAMAVAILLGALHIAG